VATLEHAGPHLTSMLKGDWMGLYRRFFRSPNFDGWYRLRRQEMTQKLECLHLEAVCDAVSGYLMAVFIRLLSGLNISQHLARSLLPLRLGLQYSSCASLLLTTTSQYHCQLVLFTEYLTYILLFYCLLLCLLFYCYAYVVGILSNPWHKNFLRD